jgi:hypothetical protein
MFRLFNVALTTTCYVIYCNMIDKNGELGQVWKAAFMTSYKVPEPV